jgi:hypothetical protein
MRGILLMNGGAILTIFAYLGNIEKSKSLPGHNFVLVAAVLFSAGFTCGVLTSLLPLLHNKK